MQISDFSISNPTKVIVGVILVSMFGLIALFQIPVQLTPEVTRMVISVDTRWPGASPQEVEKEIVSKQEEQLQDIEGMTDFRSECSNGRGQIEMEFQVGTDLNATLLRVSNKLDQVERYPEDAREPIIRTVSVSGSSIAYLSLIPRPPTRQQLEAFVGRHPELEDVLAPFINKSKIDGLDVTRIYRLAHEFPALRELLLRDPDPGALRTFAEDHVAAPLKRSHPGVADVEIYGGSEDQLHVVVDPTRLAARGITIAELRAALELENRDISGGDLWEGKRAYVIRTLGQFNSPEQVEEVIVGFRDGAPVHVRDVARVELSQSKTLGIGHQRGVNMLTAAVKRKDGANVLDVMEAIKRATDELNEGVLKNRGLYLYLAYDETVYIKSATALVRNNIFVGGALAIGVLLLFLRSGRSTLVIALAIPISIVGTFLVVRLLGRSINVISLAGMAFAVGMVVDAAIVVLENIFSHYQKGEQPKVAASRGTSEVWGAILASTLTTLAVFLPVIFIQAEAGQLFRDIAIAISVAVAISMVVSLTVIPTAASRILRPHGTGPGAKSSDTDIERHSRIGAFINDTIVDTTDRLQRGHLGRVGLVLITILFAAGAIGLVPVEYEPTRTWPHWTVQFSWLALAVSVAAIAAFIFAAPRAPRLAVVAAMTVGSIGLSYKLMPPAEYLPEGNKNLVFASLLPPPGYNVDQLVDMAGVIESRLRPYWEAEPGTPEADALDGPVIENFFLVARGGTLFMGARAVDPMRARDMIPVLRRATDGLPGTMSFVTQSSLFERSISGGRVIDIEITGPALERLVEIGGQIMGELTELYPAETQTSISPKPSLDLGSPELHIRRNLEKAAQRGVRVSDLGYAIDALVDGAYAGTYWHQGKEIDLVIYGEEREVQRTQDIAQLPIGTPTGELVRIGDVADVYLASGPERILRIDRERAITIQIRPGPEIALEDAIATIDRHVLEPIRQSGELAGLYHLRMAGTADDLKQMRSAMGGSLLLAVIITFLLIAALYESFLYPLVIMISVPLAAVGGFAGLRFLNLFTVQRLDTLTMLGFIILIGTVVNNAILIVNQALVYIRLDGWHHRDAVRESVRGRIRPIFMSTLTTLLGMLPLVLFPGAGSELYRGLGSVVLGGLLISTMFTLFLVPVLFSLMYEMRQRVAVATGRGPSAPAEPQANEQPQIIAAAAASLDDGSNGNGRSAPEGQSVQHSTHGNAP